MNEKRLEICWGGEAEWFFQAKIKYLKAKE